MSRITFRRSRHGGGRRRLAAIAATGLRALGGVAVASAPAHADVPPAPVEEFIAPLCEGGTDELPATDSDPEQATGEVPNLARVFGARLDEYNAGKVVVLYDVFGENALDGYPAVCGTRYVDSVGGPVSEWMFCTDIFSHVCSGVNAAGELIDLDGEPIEGLDSRPGNPKLDETDEKIIAWLIQNGYSYDGEGYYDLGVTTARKDLTSWERMALQVLIWCVSDPPQPDSAYEYEDDRIQTCADSFDEEDRAHVLAQIPDDPEIEILFGASGGTFTAGETATFELSTNLYGQPISLTVGGVAGTLAVTGGDATYDADAATLVVAGTDPTVMTNIQLSFTTDDVGTVNIAASARPVSRSAIGWNQSPGVAADGTACQVFATFHEVARLTVADNADANFLLDAEPEPDPEPEPEPDPEPELTPGGSTTDPGAGTDPVDASGSGLAVTGAEMSPLLPAAAGILIVAGVAAAVLARMRTRDRHES